MLKTGQEQSASPRQEYYAWLHTQFVDARAQAKDDDERHWGDRWMNVLYAADILAAVVCLGVMIAVARSQNAVGMLREPAAPGAGATVLGKVSFSRVFGLIGGLSAFVFVAFITNMCLSHVFLTGKMPDQLGTTYAAAVGTMLTALVPYLINKLSS